MIDPIIAMLIVAEVYMIKEQCGSRFARNCIAALVLILIVRPVFS